MDLSSELEANMQLYGLELEKVEDVEIKGKKYTKLTSGFLRPDNKKLYFYYDWQEETFTDHCQAYYNAFCAHVDLAVVDWVAARYHCQQWEVCELRSDDPVALIQAMIAVYAWCEMKEELQWKNK